jgi:hypothetical protein
MGDAAIVRCARSHPLAQRRDRPAITAEDRSVADVRYAVDGRTEQGKQTHRPGAPVDRKIGRAEDRYRGKDRIVEVDRESSELVSIPNR